VKCHVTSLLIVSLVDVNPSEAVAVTISSIHNDRERLFFQNVLMNMGLNILIAVHIQFFAVSV